MNIRKNYYSSLGFKSVEANTIVESALQERPLSVDKLQKLCLWVRIPHGYRVHVWKVLLGIVCVWGDSAVCALRPHRIDQFQSVLSCVSVAAKLPCDDSSVDALCVARMVMLDATDVHVCLGHWLCPPRHVRDIAAVIVDICDDACDAFWVCKRVVEQCGLVWADHYSEGAICSVPGCRCPSSVQTVQDLLTIRSHISLQSPSTLAHITRLGSTLESLALPWLSCLCACAIAPQTAEGVWDIVIGGGAGVVVCVVVCAIVEARNAIAACQGVPDLVALFDNIQRVVDMDAVVSKAVVMWEKPVLERMSRETRASLT